MLHQQQNLIFLRYSIHVAIVNCYVMVSILSSLDIVSMSTVSVDIQSVSHRDVKLSTSIFR